MITGLCLEGEESNPEDAWEAVRVSCQRQVRFPQETGAATIERGVELAGVTPASPKNVHFQFSPIDGAVDARLSALPGNVGV
jgi:hypothetical protein